ncbi:MAG: hypothetical protein O3C45_00935 [Bacteroidetes bacterium]|nr:hypothetical protein [Bacteroidota bacterium]MDA0873603.1 hypothetical protein [Bacteroidota bacterium]
MKPVYLLLTLLLCCTSTAWAQDRLRARDLEGTTWKMVFDLDNKRPRAEADNAFERIVLSAVDGLLDEIDVYFTFDKRGRMTILAGAFGEEDEEEERSDWSINDDGQLVLGDTDAISYEDTVWLRYGDRLVPFERKRNGRLERGDAIYLKRID